MGLNDEIVTARVFAPKALPQMAEENAAVFTPSACAQGLAVTAGDCREKRKRAATLFQRSAASAAASSQQGPQFAKGGFGQPSRKFKTACAVGQKSPTPVELAERTKAQAPQQNSTLAVKNVAPTNETRPLRETFRS